jgi:NAD(P)-dependent dehydrogenase (short-subunit alcohol dehydrogenase family)
MSEMPLQSRALEGRAAVITGANQGLGLAIARAYVGAGASVVLCARDADKLARAREDVAALASAGQTVVAVKADVSRPDDVTQLVRVALDAMPHIHVVVSNAAIHGPIGLIEEVDWVEWTHAIEINLLGSVLVCRGFLPHFKTHGYGKIVQLSGGGATNPMPRISAYAASKAAVVRFVETLALEVRENHIDVNAIAPGVLNTRLLDEVIAAGPERVGREYYERMIRMKTDGTSPLDRGAALAVYLGSAESDSITGRLLSAVWDPWETLDERLADLDGTDIYTLRRIVPKDRGRTWGDR